MILSCYGNFLYLYKTCITWFWANMIFFSCHKNHVRWGIALLLLRFYGPFGKFILKVIMQIRRLTKPNTLWCHLHFFNLLCALKPAINLRIFQKATFFSYYLHTYLFAWIQKSTWFVNGTAPLPPLTISYRLVGRLALSFIWPQSLHSNVFDSPIYINGYHHLII